MYSKRPNDTKTQLMPTVEGNGSTTHRCRSLRLTQQVKPEPEKHRTQARPESMRILCLRLPNDRSVHITAERSAPNRARKGGGASLLGRDRNNGHNQSPQ